MSLDELLARYHRALDAFSRGDPDPVKELSTTFRCEDGDWRIVHRHADPISTEDESGPLRTS